MLASLKIFGSCSLKVLKVGAFRSFRGTRSFPVELCVISCKSRLHPRVVMLRTQGTAVFWGGFSPGNQSLRKVAGLSSVLFTAVINRVQAAPYGEQKKRPQGSSWMLSDTLAQRNIHEPFYRHERPVVFHHHAEEVINRNSPKPHRMSHSTCTGPK